MSLPKLTLVTEAPSTVETDLLAVPVHEDEVNHLGHRQIMEAFPGIFDVIVEEEGFVGGRDQHLLLRTHGLARRSGTGPGPRRVLLFGLGKGSELRPEVYRERCSVAAHNARKLKARNITVSGLLFSRPEQTTRWVRPMVEGLLMASGHGGLFKKVDSSLEEIRISLWPPPPANFIDAIERLMEEVTRDIEAVLLARELGNAPANVMTPQSFVARGVELFEGGPISC